MLFYRFSLINNRDTPFHWDNGARYSTMDTLLTVGKYQKGWLYLSGLGYRLFYNSGTMVMLGDELLDMERVPIGSSSVALGISDPMSWRSLNVDEPAWVTVDDFV